MDDILAIDGLRKSYGPSLEVLRGIDFTARKG